MMADELAILLSDHAAAAMLGISRATFWRRVNDGSLPKPIKLGAATRWHRSELLAVVNAALARRDAEAA